MVTDDVKILAVSPGRLPGLDHHRAEPARNSWGRALQGPGDAGGEGLVTDDVDLGGDHDLLAPGLAPALVQPGLGLRDAAQLQPRNTLAQPSLTAEMTMLQLLEWIDEQITKVIYSW